MGWSRAPNDLTAGVGTRLHGYGGQFGPQVISCPAADGRQVAYHEGLRMSGHAQIGADDPTTAAQL